MKVLYASNGDQLFDADIGDIYVNETGEGFLRLHRRTTKDPTWQPLGKRWRELMGLTDEERAYLRKTLGVPEDVDL